MMEGLGYGVSRECGNMIWGLGFRVSGEYGNTFYRDYTGIILPQTE